MQQLDVGTVITVTLTDSAGTAIDVSEATNKHITCYVYKNGQTKKYAV